MNSLSEKNAAGLNNYDNWLLVISLAAVVFYTLCSTPSIGWRDGPELVVTASYLDVAHPSGFPVYNLLAKIITWLPLGSLSFRANLFSALASGAAVFFMGLLLGKIHLFRQAPVSRVWLLAGLPWFAMHQGVWAASTEVEVYSLNVLFVVCLLYCAASWFEGRGVHWLYFGGLLYGFACGNHASLSLYLPIFLMLTIWGKPPETRDGSPQPALWSRIVVLAVIFIVALSAYFLLIIRSQTDMLPVDFARTNTLERFWAHISDAKDSEFHTRGILEVKRLSYFVSYHFDRLTSPGFWLGLPFVLWGLKYLWNNYQILSVSLVSLILINMGFFFYWVDGVAAFLPTVMAWFLLLSLGLGQFGRLLEKLKVPRMAGCLAAVLVMALGFGTLGWQRLAERESESGFFALEMFWPDLSKLPPEAMVLEADSWFQHLALQHIYKARPDVSIVFAPSLQNSLYITPLVPSKFPLLVYPDYLDGIGSFYDRLSAFILVNMEAGIPVFFQYSLQNSFLMNYGEPSTDFMWLAKMSTDSASSMKSVANGDFAEYLDRVSLYVEDRAAAYGSMPVKSAAHFYHFTRPVLELLFAQGEHAVNDKFMKVFDFYFTGPDGRLSAPYDVSLNLTAFKADNLLMQNRFEEARVQLDRLVAADPSKDYSYLMLAVSYDRSEMPEDSLAALQKAIDFDPYNTEYAMKKAVLLAKYHSVQDGLDYLAEASRAYSDYGLPNQAELLLSYRSCLLLPPEENVLKVSTIDSDMREYLGN
ncbi:MAG: DUF2723 domain-containing protein [Deltaproteobacteria bacterium]|jgi:tetratricopeptide (TPR) repeat protein|nr:DUF2723 domain-containing protein [Deltaproteobacteria bacterium]